MIAAREAPPERDERQLALHQVVDPRIDTLRVGDDHAVGEPPLDDAAHIGERILIGAA